MGVTSTPAVSGVGVGVTVGVNVGGDVATTPDTSAGTAVGVAVDVLVGVGGIGGGGATELAAGTPVKVGVGLGLLGWLELELG
jgi:hypothetical protein